MNFINRLLNVPSTDPDDARRRKLLNILLSGMVLIALLGLLFTFYLDISANEIEENIKSLYIASSTMLIRTVLLFLINRYGASWLASTLFLLLITFTIVLGEEPEHLITSVMFFLTLPVLMASILIRPWASFIMAALIGIIIIRASWITTQVINIPAVMGFFFLALISWLSARSLENALSDLRALNVDLERRVEDRTRELAEANQELAKANARLKELDRLKSHFVSMVSHELRTPLNAIQGFAEMLKAGVYGQVASEQQTPLNRITANVGRLLGIVNDLLDEARIEAGELALHIDPLSLADLGADLHSTMDVLAESKNLALSTEIDPALPEKICGDRQRLHQIMVNLVNNAFKFTEEGGIYIRMYRPDIHHWAIDVMDTGPGIPKEAQQYIFEPFRQVDGSTTRKYKGAGLGLSIVLQLTRLMGGEVRLESEVGHGSTFTIVLPLVTPEEKEEEICPSSLH